MKRFILTREYLVPREDRTIKSVYRRECFEEVSEILERIQCKHPTAEMLERDLEKNRVMYNFFITDMRRYSIRKGTGKGYEWVKLKRSKNGGEVIINRAEKFLDCMSSFKMGERNWAEDAQCPDTVYVDINDPNDKELWRASLYYIFLEYRQKISRLFYPPLTEQESEYYRSQRTDEEWEELHKKFKGG